MDLITHGPFGILQESKRTGEWLGDNNKNRTPFLRSNPYFRLYVFIIYQRTIVNPSTPRPEGQGLLRVDPERRSLPRLKGRGLAPPNGSRFHLYPFVFSLLPFLIVYRPK
jgi:hypothetical protein